MRIVTTDMHAYDAFLRDKILALGLVSDIQSRIIVNIASPPPPPPRPHLPLRPHAGPVSAPPPEKSRL